MDRTDAPPPPPQVVRAMMVEAAFEEGFQQTRELLHRAPARSGSGALWFVLTLALFVIVFAGFDPIMLALLVGVLLFHESGHYMGMQVFGYQDVRMFFIPFFGAAVSGKKPGARAWQKAIVLFLGPLPGLILGAVLWAATIADPPQVVRQAVFLLIVLNAFNLLPIFPLDGGRIANLVLFARRPTVEAVFQAVAGVTLGAIALVLGEIVLGIFGALTLFGASGTLRAARVAFDVREAWDHAVPARLEDLGESRERDLYRRVQASFATSLGTTAQVAPLAPKSCASWMRIVHERAADEAPDLATSLAISAVFVMSWLGLGALLLAVLVVEGARAA